MIQAIVFDFDGLILDTETAWYDAYNEIYQERGVEMPIEKWALLVGTHGGTVFDPYQHLAEISGQPVDKEEIQRRAAEKVDVIMQSRPLRPGVEQYLHTSRELGIKIGLASSSTREWVEGFLKKFNLYDSFEIIRTSNDVKKVKPDPELYLSALLALGVPSANALAFEDSPNGARAAKAAGMYCCIVPNAMTTQFKFDEHDLRIESMEEMELAVVLERIKNMASQASA